MRLDVVTAAVVAAALAAAWAGRARAAATQGALSFPNADFFVSFQSYDVTGPLRLVTFEPAPAVCAAELESVLVPGAVAVLLYSRIVAARCAYAYTAADGLAARYLAAVAADPALAARRPAAVLAVDDASGDTDYADYWLLTPRAASLGLPFTSLRGVYWDRLDRNGTLTLTPGTNVWQTAFLSDAFYAYYVATAVVWGVCACLFALTVTADLVGRLRTGQGGLFLWKLVVSVVGLVFSSISCAVLANKALLWTQRDIMIVGPEFSLYLASYLAVYIGVLTISVVWLNLLRDTKFLSVRMSRVLLVTLQIFLCGLLVAGVLGIISFFLEIGISTATLVVALVVVMIVATLVALGILVLCFWRLWSGIMNKTSRHVRRRLWKLAFVSVASITTMLILLVLLAVILASTTSPYYDLAISATRTYAPLPMMISWLSVSTLWESVAGALGLTTGASTGDISEEARSGSSGAVSRRLKSARDGGVETTSMHELNTAPSAAAPADADADLPAGLRAPQVYAVGGVQVEL